MRYQRLEPLDVDHECIQDSTVAVVGLGATGSHMAANLARLGTDLILIDRDYLEPSNLSTSALYTEDHVEEQLPKAVAAEQVLEAINSDIQINAHTTDVNRYTVDTLLDAADIVLDGTDNMETRYLLNEYSIKTRTPWIHLSALGHTGEIMPVIPKKQVQAQAGSQQSQSNPPPRSPGACFNCLFNEVDASRLDTCETAGILKETAATAANIATRTAIDVLAGQNAGGLTRFDLQRHEMRTLTTERREDCTVCQHRQFPFLSGEDGSTTTALCGENKYQVRPGTDTTVELAETATALKRHGTVEQNEHLLRFENTDAAFTLFQDGRAIIAAESPERAKSIYSRFVGD